ncbi:MAG TPA: TonB-dependent receptor [Vicinamibacterales bacterium]|nr:TonB-dependent receptor [Vicinamibacterales bacterium]
MPRLAAVLASVLVLASPAIVAAQRTTGEIVGKVTDESGAVLPGVTVTIRGLGVAGAPTTVTSETGDYRFPVLPAGTYDVDYALQGFGTLRRADIPVGVGATVTLDVTLKLSAVAETVTVTGESPVVNVTATEMSTNYTKEWTQNAPVRRNSYFDYLNSAPGISQTSYRGTTTSATSLGSSTNENQYLIDGTNISSFPWLNTDILDEVQVLQLGASAEFGGVQGAVFNVVTRQGSNVFHGDLNYYYQNDAFVSRNTTSDFDRGWPYHLARFKDVTFQTTGPFIMDKFWFFGSLGWQRYADSQPGVDPNYPGQTTTSRWFWKFNYNLTPNHRLMHGYHDDNGIGGGAVNQFTAPSAATQGRGHNPTPNVVYTGVLSSKMVLEARYSGFWWMRSDGPNLDEPTIMTRYVDADTGYITGGISGWDERRSYRSGGQVKFTRYADQFLGGGHDLNLGVQYIATGESGLFGSNDTITTYGLTGRTSFGTTQLPYFTGTNGRWLGLYADDVYRVGGRTTINIGVRYDRAKGFYPSFPMLDQFARPTGVLSAANDDVVHTDSVSPRAGVSVKVSNKTVLKGHYGRYYAELPADFSAIVPSTTPSSTFRFDAAGNRVNFTSQTPANLRVEQSRKSAHTDQFIVQAERELFRNIGLQVNYVHKRGDDYASWQDIAGQYVQVPYVDSVGAGATGQAFMVYRLVSPPNDRIFLLTTPSGLFTRYNGVTFIGTKRMSNNWQGTFSLVLSKSEGRISSSARTSPSSSQSSSAGSFGRDAAGPNDFVNTEGRLIGDKPVVVKANLVYRMPWRVMVAANVQHQTGRLWSRQIRPSGLGFPSAPTINMEPNTGDRRVADVNFVDLRIQKDVAIPRSALRLGLFFDALNLTNSDAFEGLGSQLGTSSAFGVPINFVTPRRIQLGTKLQW